MHVLSVGFVGCLVLDIRVAWGNALIGDAIRMMKHVSRDVLYSGLRLTTAASEGGVKPCLIHLRALIIIVAILIFCGHVRLMRARSCLDLRWLKCMALPASFVYRSRFAW